MKRFLSSILFAFILCGCTKQVAVNQPGQAPNADFTITGSWKFDYTNFAPCSSTVTSGCISGFTFGYINAAGAQVALKTDTSSVCSGTTQPESCTDVTNSQLPMGNVNFYVMANFVNNSGVAGSSPVTLTATPLTITSGQPTAFTVTAQ